MSKGIVMGAVGLVVVGGGVFAAGRMGVVKIPGITPPKPKAAAASKEPVKTPTKAAPKAAPPTVRPKVVRSGDPAAGVRKVANLWNEVPIDRLVPLCDAYQDAELARVLAVMDGEKASQVLAALEPKRAAALSKLVERVVQSAEGT